MKIKPGEGMSIGDAAKLLGTGRNRLFAWLKEHHYIMPKTKAPYQEYIENGLMLPLEQHFYKQGMPVTTIKPLITEKGLEHLKPFFEVPKLTELPRSIKKAFFDGKEKES